MDEEGIDSEADVNLLFFCSKECSYKDIECMSLIDQMEFEKKKYGFITDETIRKSKEFKKHG